MDSTTIGDHTISITLVGQNTLQNSFTMILRITLQEPPPTFTGGLPAIIDVFVENTMTDLTPSFFYTSPIATDGTGVTIGMNFDISSLFMTLAANGDSTFTLNVTK